MAMGRLERAVRRRTARLGQEVTDATGLDPVLTAVLPNGSRWPKGGELLVALLIARALDRAKDVREALLSTVPIVTVRVPDPTWSPVMEAVFADVLLRRFPHLPSDAFEDTARRRLSFATERAPQRGPRWLDRHDRDFDDDDPAMGYPIVAVWSTSVLALPEVVLSLASHSLEIDRPDVRTLTWLVETFTGSGDARLELSPEEAGTAAPWQISIAVQRSLSGREAVDRLHRLLRKKTFRSAPVTLADLHGLDEARKWGEDLARDLAEMRAGRLTWDSVDRGALLSGPSGVGKTLFAKALAATCGVPLVATSVSLWHKEQYLNGTLTAMRKDFAKAMSMTPSIIFVDEVDGIGNRATIHGEYRQYWDQVVNTLLECLDGCDRRVGVVVVAACNDPDRIDPAILRSGRLERHIRIPMPSASALESMFRHYLAGSLAGEDLVPIAALARGGTGADVERWVREARRIARNEGRTVRLDDLAAAIRGPASELPPALRYRVALHEAGHAVAAHAFDLSPTISLTLRTGGPSLGVTSIETVGCDEVTASGARRLIAYVLAGRAAEEIFLGDPSAGAGGAERSDLCLATGLAAALEGSFGLGRSLTWLAAPNDLPTLLSHPKVATAVDLTLSEAYREVSELLAARADTVRAIAAALDERGHLSPSDVAALVNATRQGR